MEEYIREEISNEENYRCGFMHGYSAAAGELIHQIVNGTTSPHEVLRSLQKEKARLSKWSGSPVRKDIAEGRGLWGLTDETEEAGGEESSSERISGPRPTDPVPTVITP
jgi:hypothetical protein